MVQMKRVLFHVAVICGLVCADTKVLDWYNPYMDFGGHIAWVSMSGCVAVLLFGIMQIIFLYERIVESKRNYHGHIRKNYHHQMI